MRISATFPCSGLKLGSALRILGILPVFVVALPAHTHEFWLEPLDYQIAPDGMVQAELVNGEFFEGSRLSYLPQSFERFEMVSGDGHMDVENRLGARPALDTATLGEGLHVVSYMSKMATLNYAEWDKFASFAAHKDFEGVEAAHAVRALPRDGFREGYWRFAKALVGVGHAQGSDRRTGLLTEFVALDNPYTDDLSQGMRFALFYGDDIRADAQVELYRKGAPKDDVPDNVIVTLHRTDAAGIVTLPVEQGYSYMVDAVLLREPSPAQTEQSGIVWETLWATTTFAVGATPD